MALTQKTFADLINFSRSSVATRFNAFGQLESVAANEPRFDYDPITKQLRGLLIEEQRTNMLRYSSGLDSGAWIKGSGVSISTDGTLGPDGVPMQLVTLSGTDSHQICQVLPSTLVVGRTYTLSAYVMPKGAPFSLQLAYYDSSNSLDSRGVTPEAGKLQRIKFTFTPTAAAASPQIRLIGFSGGSDGAQVYLGGLQLEVGAFETSLIPTATAQATRAADIATVNGLSPWFNPLESTLYVEVMPCEPDSSSRGFASLYVMGTSINRLGLFRQSGVVGNFLWYNNPGTPDRGGNTKAIPRQVNKGALAFSSSGARSFSVNGGAVVSANAVGGPSFADINTLGLMRAYGTTNEIANGHLRALRYWPRLLSDAELQALTA
ncbi:carbohydrate binding domain-containing protein [Pseudomonas sp. NPDC086581]|uniref:phage head spike fiber domain-containing protein n=1 Tax=Pseudomonas sp. NPDC086581 TaxID=3364432 RepID=UPI003800C10F